jgi:hypothetical protein
MSPRSPRPEPVRCGDLGSGAAVGPRGAAAGPLIGVANGEVSRLRGDLYG